MLSKRLTRVLAGAAIVIATPALAQPLVANAVADSTDATASSNSPQMLGSLAFNPKSHAVDMGGLGRWSVGGVLSGIALAQSKPTALDHAALADIGNGQVFVQKTTGVLQFFVEAGAYSIPTLGIPYVHQTDSRTAATSIYGVVPYFVLKLEPLENLSIVAGKLPSLFSAETTFTFQNFNIQRGLLSQQEPSVSRGVQVNLTAGSVTMSLSINDGFYSNRYSWLSGAATWAIDAQHSVVLVAGANLARTAVSTLVTPLEQNNGALFDLIYILVAGPFSLTPSLHYAAIPRARSIGIGHDTSSYGAALLASYTMNNHWSLSGRVEYLGTTGRSGDPSAPNLLYGPGSGAASATLTPTYYDDRFFARCDLSIVRITNLGAGAGFGADGRSRSQVRAVLETGVVF